MFPSDQIGWTGYGFEKRDALLYFVKSAVKRCSGIWKVFRYCFECHVEQNSGLRARSKITSQNSHSDSG